MPRCHRSVAASMPALETEPVGGHVKTRKRPGTRPLLRASIAWENLVLDREVSAIVAEPPVLPSNLAAVASRSSEYLPSVT